MGHLFFFLAVGASCLLWSAAFIAAAARTRQGWMRWLFVATPIRYQRAFLGEEVFGLATLAELLDGTRGASTMELPRSVSDAPTARTTAGRYRPTRTRPMATTTSACGWAARERHFHQQR